MSLAIMQIHSVCLSLGHHRQHFPKTAYLIWSSNQKRNLKLRLWDSCSLVSKNLVISCCWNFAENSKEMYQLIKVFIKSFVLATLPLLLSRYLKWITAEANSSLLKRLFYFLISYVMISYANYVIWFWWRIREWRKQYLEQFKYLWRLCYM